MYHVHTSRLHTVHRRVNCSSCCSCTNYRSNNLVVRRFGRADRVRWSRRSPRCRTRRSPDGPSAAPHRVVMSRLTSQRPVDRRRYSRLSLFSEPTYNSIGDPYTDGRSVAGPPAGVIGSVTCMTENKSSFFPPRLCWGVRAAQPPLARLTLFADTLAPANAPVGI